MGGKGGNEAMLKEWIGAGAMQEGGRGEGMR